MNKKRKATDRLGDIRPLKSAEEALTLALILGITCETDREYDRVLPLIEELSANVDEVTIARCKRAALKHLNMTE
jgi:hypothetical protein